PEPVHFSAVDLSVLIFPQVRRIGAEACRGGVHRGAALARVRRWNGFGTGLSVTRKMAEHVIVRPVLLDDDDPMPDWNPLLIGFRERAGCGRHRPWPEGETGARAPQWIGNDRVRGGGAARGPAGQRAAELDVLVPASPGQGRDHRNDKRTVRS